MLQKNRMMALLMAAAISFDPLGTTSAAEVHFDGDIRQDEAFIEETLPEENEEVLPAEARQEPLSINEEDLCTDEENFYTEEEVYIGEEDLYTDEEDLYTDEEDLCTDEEDLYTDEEDLYTDEESLHTEEDILLTDSFIEEISEEAPDSLEEELLGRMAGEDEPFKSPFLENEWIEGFFCVDMVPFGEIPEMCAQAKYGEVVFRYAKEEEGPWSETLPTETGDWFVKAFVDETEEYDGLESEAWPLLVYRNIVIEPEKLKLFQGRTGQFSAKMLPEPDPEESIWVNWESSDKAVASVTQDGLVTALGGGTSIITAFSEEGFSATALVEVMPLEESGQCGDQLFWDSYVDGDRHILLIHGTGKMWDRAEWNTYPAYMDQVIVEEGVENIGAGVFEYCSTLQSIELPETVTRIGQAAFFGCTALTSLEIPSSVTWIDGSAFASCSSLEKVILPEEMAYLGSGTFSSCTGLKEICIPAGLTALADSMFSGCTSLWKVEFREGLSMIENHAFEECVELSDVTLPLTLKEIGARAFRNCKMESMNLPEGLTKIGNAAFDGTGLLEITVPGSVAKIEVFTFYGCQKLKKVTLETGVEEIESNAFMSCVSLTDISLPDTLVKIGAEAFGADYALETIKLPEGIAQLPDGLFANDTGLKEVKLPQHLEKIGSRAFDSCQALEEIFLPGSLTEIGERAFSGCSSLRSIVIPSKITELPYGVLSGCYQLEHVTLPDGLIRIGTLAFSEDYNLPSLFLPDTLEEIGDAALPYLTAGTITLPASIKKIGGGQCAGRAEGLPNMIYLGSDQDWAKVDVNESDNVMFAENQFMVTFDRVVYSGGACEPVFTVRTKSGTLLNKDEDYELEYYENIQVGNALAKITFLGSYNAHGEGYLPFRINAIDASGASIAAIRSQTFTGEAIMPEVKVTLGSDSDAIIIPEEYYEVGYSDNINAGTATVTLTFTGIYTGEVSRNFTISRKNASSAQIEDIPVQYYTGQALTPQPVIHLDGRELIQGTDFQITYRDNIQPGEATARISFTGNYIAAAVVSKTFRIAVNGEEVKIGGLSSQRYTGAEITPKVELSFEDALLVEGEDYELAYRDNSQIGDASIDITFLGNYTGSRTVTFAIFEDDISHAVSVDFDEDIVFDGGEKKPAVRVTLLGEELEEGRDYLVEYTNNVNAGTGQILLTYLGEYKGSTQVPFTIKKAVYDMSGVTFHDARFGQNGQPKSLEIAGELPEGVTVRYEGNAQTQPGTYTVTAYFDSPSQNYEEIPPMSAVLIIGEECGHLWEERANEEPSCEAWGYFERYCPLCGAMESGNIEPLGHDWVETGVTVYDCLTESLHEITCSRCQASYTETAYGQYGAHALTHEVGMQPTCTADGILEHWHCTTCGRDFQDENATQEVWESLVLPMREHSWQNPVFTWMKDGMTFYWNGTEYENWIATATMTCEYCGDTIHVDISMGTPDVTEPTVDAEGKITFYAYDTQDYHISDEKEIILPALEFTYGDPAFRWIDLGNGEMTAEAYVVCDQDGRQLELPVTLTTLEDQSLPATCTAEGITYYRAETIFRDLRWTEDGQCSIPKLPHSLSYHEGVPATCTEPGSREYWQCSLCGQRFEDSEGTLAIVTGQEIIPANGHEWSGEYTVDIAPDYEKEGWESIHCRNCDETTDGRAIPKLIRSEDRTADQTAADLVTDQIAHLSGMADLSEKEAVEKARAAYEALSEEQKVLISSEILAKLQTAETELAEAVKAEEEAKKKDEETRKAEEARKAEEEQKAEEARKAEEAQKEFTLNVKANTKNIPVQLKKKNSQIVVKTLAKGDKLKSAVSTNKNVKVSVKGKKVIVTGQKAGAKATITVKTKNGAVMKFTVKVQKPAVKTKKLTVSKTKVTLKVKKTYNIEAVVTPVTTTDKLKYTTSDKKVATVNKAGKIKALRPGTAKITVISGTKKKVITVTVKK